jgi:hypothetical protein
MDLSYGITCRRNNIKRPLFAFPHFYDVRPVSATAFTVNPVEH